eukprot:526747-Rhodomonas_salina.3
MASSVVRALRASAGISSRIVTHQRQPACLHQIRRLCVDREFLLLLFCSSSDLLRWSCKDNRQSLVPRVLLRKRENHVEVEHDTFSGVDQDG